MAEKTEGAKAPTWAEQYKLGEGQYKYDDVDNRWMFVKPDRKTFIIDVDSGKPIEGMPLIPSIYDRLGGQPQSPVTIPDQPDMEIKPTAPTVSSLPVPPPTAVAVTPAAELDDMGNPIIPAKKIKAKGPGGSAKKASPLKQFNGPETLIQAKRPANGVSK